VKRLRNKNDRLWLLDASFAFFNEWFWCWEWVMFGLLLGLVSWIYFGEWSHLGWWLLGCFTLYTIVGTLIIWGLLCLDGVVTFRDIVPDND
jgi:hypothetical protein